MEGLTPQPSYVIMGLQSSSVACELAFRLFQRSKRAFADVL